MKEFDLAAAKAGQPLQTRSGVPARILTYDARTTGPLVGLIEYMPGHELTATWNAAGEFTPPPLDSTGGSPFDIGMVPYKARLFIAVADPRQLPDADAANWVSHGYACKQDLEEFLRTCFDDVRKHSKIIEIEVEF